MMVTLLALAPSPQQAFNGQGVLRIPGLFCFFCLHHDFFCCSPFLYFLILLSGDIESNPGPSRHKFCRLLYCNIRGLHGNLLDLAAVSSQFDIVCCSETLVTDRRHVSELLLPNFGRPLLLLRNAIHRAQGLCIYVRKGFNAYRFNKYECGCHEFMVVRVCSRFNNFYIFSLYRNPTADDGLFDCLFASYCNIQINDKKSCFVFIGDFNAHHTEWLGSHSPTDRHGISALNFCDSVGCDQLVTGPTHISGNPLDLLLTDVSGLIDVQTSAPIGSSDHCSLHCRLQLDFSIPDFTVTRQVFLKSCINWDGLFRAFDGIVWKNVYSAVCPVEALNAVLINLVNRFVPTKRLKSRSHNKAWFNDRCEQAYRDKQSAYHLWSTNRSQLCWDNYIAMRKIASNVYKEAEASYNSHLKDILSGTSQPHTWWSALKSSLFGIDSSIPPLLKPDGSVTYDPLEKARIFAANFNSKQSSESIHLPHGCHQLPRFNSISFRSSEIKYLLSNLDEFGGTDPNGLFPLFLKRLAPRLSPKLAVVFRILIRRGTFPECWRLGNITPVPKGVSSSPSPNDYRPISITPILSKIFERLLVKRLFVFLDPFLPDVQFGFRKGLGTCDALLLLVHELQSALDKNVESRVVSLDFSAAFDSINHKGLIFKLGSVGIGGKVLSILTDFVTNRQQRVCIDGSFSSFSPVFSGVPQGSVLGPLLFILYTSDMCHRITNKFVSYADDTSLYAHISSPTMRPLIAESLNNDLNIIHAWCMQWGMRLNPNKTKDLIISRSRTINPAHPPLSINGTLINTTNQIRLLGVTLDSKLTFRAHLREMSRVISSKLGILRKCSKIYQDDDILRNCFFSFILPHFEYCAPVWMSAADSHLDLLDRAFSSIRYLLSDLTLSLSHRRTVGALCILYKIINADSHPLKQHLPGMYIPSRVTRQSVALNSLSFEISRCSSSQFSRCFFPAICRQWNRLPDEVVTSRTMMGFKSLVNKSLLDNG